MKNSAKFLMSSVFLGLLPMFTCTVSAAEERGGNCLFWQRNGEQNAWAKDNFILDGKAAVMQVNNYKVTVRARLDTEPDWSTNRYLESIQVMERINGNWKQIMSTVQFFNDLVIITLGDGDLSHDPYYLQCTAKGWDPNPAT